ncbi:BTB/POZ domain-containing protein [Apostasia shenzhenica]|uniref:BTB/POZ domain-containing protein n=1 Tax=Apostasia shenzhenica TaxID=1088818 RepID=A0A2I0A936_9ASPA|nr:BTB/POZ domain-containing protein [Apostasia shenzhenica]
MEKRSIAQGYTFGDKNTSDITILLKSWEGRPEFLHCHSAILIKKSKFFADRLSLDYSTCRTNEPMSCIQVPCKVSEYDHYLKLLKLMYLSEDSLLESWDSVKSTLGVLRASIDLNCNSVTQSCIQYLEAVPWDEKEEEEVLKIIPKLGPAAVPILARIQPVNFDAAKNVFISAVRFSTCIERSFPPFTDELKTSAQEQMEYMLTQDEDAPLLTADEAVRSEVRTGLINLFTTFESELISMMQVNLKRSAEEAEKGLLQSLSDLEWMCCMLPKMEMMKDFVSCWADITDKLLSVLQNEVYILGLWEVKVKVIELVGKALDAIGYGSIVLPAPLRVQFLKTWLPYLRKMKPLLDLKSKDEFSACRLDADLCQNIEGAIVSLILALPSGDQAEIFGEWMQSAEQLSFPDLSEAFEVWCYRTKTAKRRLFVGLNEAGNHTVSL